jgi:hypothetical protein
MDVEKLEGWGAVYHAQIWEHGFISEERLILIYIKALFPTM